MLPYGSKTPVSMLQEHLIANNQIPSYDLICNGVGTHNPKFIYRVSAGELFAVGEGTSKQQAKHNAAQALIDIITNRSDCETSQLKDIMDRISSPNDNNLGYNAVGELSDYCAENSHPEPIYELIRDEGPPHARIFTYKCSVSNLSDLGTARTKKQAKHQSARSMIVQLKTLAGEEINAIAPIKKIPEASPSKKSRTTRDAEVTEKFFELTNVKRTPTTSMFIGDHHRVIINLSAKSDTLVKLVNGTISIDNSEEMLSNIAEELGVTIVKRQYPVDNPTIYFVKLLSTPIICNAAQSYSEAAKSVLTTILSYFR